MLPDLIANENGARRVLLVQSDADIAQAMALSLTDGHGAATARCAHVDSIGALRAMALDGFDLVITARTLSDGTWREALACVRDIDPMLGVIVSGEPGHVDIAVEAIRAGAIDYIGLGERALRALPLVVEKCAAHQAMRRENARLHSDLSRSLGELETKNRQLESVIQQLETMARTDELTGLANRRWLNLMLTGAWAESLRHDLPLGFIMIDLDGFKTLNDEAGHQQGDDVLRHVGMVIQANCREVDVCARYGGDEFSILLPHTEVRATMAIASRLLHELGTMSKALCARESLPSFGASLGVSHLMLSRPSNADELVRHADEALYAGKSAGRGVVMVHAGDEIHESAGVAR